MGRYFQWEKLPEDLQAKVLARLPLECLGRFCTVSKTWNAMLSSTKFVKTVWAQTPPNRNPLLIAIGRLDAVVFCQSYNFTTRIWEKRFSFSFLQEKAAAIPGACCVGLDCISSAAGLCIVDLKPVSFINQRLTTKEYFLCNRPGACCVGLDCISSAAGLCIMDLKPVSVINQRLTTKEYFLCNPITRTFMQLPHITSRESIGIMEGEGNSYKIVAFSEQRDGGHMKVSTYDPSQKIWTMVGQLPSNLKLAQKTIVASKSSVYCLVDIEREVYRIVGFNIEDGTFNIIPLPKFLGINPLFFACGGRLLFVGYTIQASTPSQDERQLQDESEFEDEDESEFEAEDKFDIGYEREQLVIWELQENVARSSNSSPSSCWEEIARMPSSISWKLRSSHIIGGGWPCYFDCVGAGDYVVFSTFKRDRIFYYDLSEQSWESIPIENCYANLFAFEPRPDVKVE